MNILSLQFLLGVVFLTIIFLHLIRKNFGAVIAYGIQSFATVLILFGFFFETKNVSLLLVIFVAFAIKVILAPIIFTAYHYRPRTPRLVVPCAFSDFYFSFFDYQPQRGRIPSAWHSFF